MSTHAQADIEETSKPKLDVASTSVPRTPTAAELAALGLGPARSRSFVSSHPETAAAIVDFAKACEANGARFKVFQSSGRNGYYAQLRLKVITGAAANAYTDSRGYEGPSQVCEVGSMSTTKSQARGLDAALTSLAKEAEIPFVRRQVQVSTAKRGMSL